MFKILKHLKAKDYLLFFAVTICIVAQVYLELKIPEFFSNLINLITEQSTSIVDYTPIYQTALIMALYILGAFVVYILVSLFMSFFSSSVSKTLRSDFYKKIMNLSVDEVKEFSTASLVTRTTNDISQVQRFLTMGLRMAITAPIMAVLAIIKIMQSNLSLTIGTIVAVSILVCLITMIFVIAIPKFKKIQTLTDKLNLISRENLTGVKVIRAYNKEKYHEQRFENANEELNKTNIFIDKVMSLLDPVIIFVFSTLVLFIYCYGATLVSSAALNIGDIMAFAQYAIMVLIALTSLTFVFIMFPRASVSMKRLNEVFDSKVSVEFLEKSKTVSTDPNSPYISYKNVSFKYPGAKECVLKNISFDASKGQTIAFIGSTGSGKSTLINLLVRFYDCFEGEILIEGQNIKDFSKEDLLSKVSYVPQQGLLFTGTIESNLKIGNENATEEELEKACDVAQASSFVSKYKDGLNHEVANSGSNFSGGQRQRLAIARAIVKKSDIIVFDDSFSALDYKTDKKLRKALNKEFPEKTKFIVAQRVGTIIDANLIIVLEKGEVVGMGTHDELMQSCPVYKQIAESQLGKEDVDL